MSYKTRRYEQGLSGKRPGWLVIDKEGHGAQEAGYRDYLRNQDLADRIRESQESGGSGGDYGLSEPPPLTPAQKIFWVALGTALLIPVVFFYLRFLSSLDFSQLGLHAFDVVVAATVAALIFSLPGLVIISVSLTKDDDKDKKK